MRSVATAILLLAAVSAFTELLAKDADSTAYILTDLVFIGNKTTKDYIIERELVVEKGQQFPSKESLDKLLELSRQNLMNTSLFNFVTVQVFEDSGRITAIFYFTERWYIWPVPIAEIADRNLNIWWQEKNWDRVNLGFIFSHNNFRGRREKIAAISRFGYNQTYALGYEIPYLNKKKTLGIAFSAGMNAAHEVNYLTLNHKPVYYKNENAYARREYFFSLRGIYRPSINYIHSIVTSFSHYTFNDTILKLNPDYIPSGNSKLSYVFINYQFKADFRDYASYPLTGHYADADISRYFFVNSRDGDFSQLRFSFRKYFKHSPLWYSAIGVSGRISENRQKPYLMSGALGLGRDFVRGYQNYLINGQHYAYAKSNLKFNVLPVRVFQLPFIRSEKFNKVPISSFVNVFFDAGYVSDKHTQANNPMANRFHYGYGPGLDIITYYDIVVRFEYTFNDKRESGFFVNLIAPI